MTSSSAGRTAASEPVTASADATFYRLGPGFACLSTETSDHFAPSIEFAVNYSNMALTAVRIGSWGFCQNLQRVLE